ncbi:MAG: B12-binding domain-containing radical SAM protein [Nitrospinota bacterium]|nr:B12-binding domain-containing radical SAM protein [Nitrospinota bacterium]
MKIVLSNSVGIGSDGERYVHFPSRWSAVESPSWYDHRKGRMTFYPFMLAYGSALLKRETEFDVKFLDPNLNDWNHSESLKNIVNEKPDWLVMESSTLSFDMDMKLALAAREECGCKLIFAGQHPSAFPEEALKAGADVVCIGEYEFTLLEFFKSAHPEKVAGIYPNGRRELADPNLLPWPEDDDVRRIDYIEPVVSRYREVEMFSSRGCPLACNFCVASNVYYGGAGSWRPRNVDDVTNEIAAMKSKYPEMEGVFFDDEIHNGRKEFTMELCRSIVDKGLDTLKYNAMCGYWNMDSEMLSAMKRAGYYRLRVGIETADSGVAKRIGKSHSMKRLYRALECAASEGIEVYGTFTYGATGSSAESDRGTTELVKDLLRKGLLCDIQISICTPQPGTPFFKEARESGRLAGDDWKKFDGGRNVIAGYPHYSSKEIEQVVSEARRASSLFGGATRFAGVDFSDVGEFLSACEGNILIIGSGPAWQSEKILDEIKTAGCISRTHMLARKDLKGEFAERVNITTFGDGPLTIESLGDETLRSIKEKNISSVIVQVNHNRADISDYEEIFRLAETVCPSMAAVNVSGNVLPVPLPKAGEAAGSK